MVIIPLLKRHWGSQDRGSVASQTNQPRNKPKMNNQKKNPRAHAHFLVYPLHLHKQNDSDIIKWHHDHLLFHLGGKSLHACAVESCQLACTSADIPNLFLFTNYEQTAIWILYPDIYAYGTLPQVFQLLYWRLQLIKNNITNVKK